MPHVNILGLFVCIFLPITKQRHSKTSQSTLQGTGVGPAQTLQLGME